MKKNFFIFTALIALVCVIFVSCGSDSEQSIAERLVDQQLQASRALGISTRHLETEVTRHEAYSMSDTTYFLSAVYDDDDDIWHFYKYDIDSMCIRTVYFPEYNEYKVTHELVDGKYTFQYTDVKTMRNGAEYVPRTETEIQVSALKRRYYCGVRGVDALIYKTGRWYYPSSLCMDTKDITYETLE